MAAEIIGGHSKHKRPWDMPLRCDLVLRKHCGFAEKGQGQVERSCP